MNKKSKREDVNTTDSSHVGFLGAFERILRKFKNLVHGTIMLPLYLLGALVIGTSFLPGYLVFQFLHEQNFSSHFMRAYVDVFSLGLGLILAGFSLMLLIPLVVFVLRAYPKAYRGPYYSVEMVPWYIHNGLLYLLRYSFLELVTPTPFNLWFYRRMGMKMGKGCTINSAQISDPCMIELGDYVTIGGSATVLAHYGAGGYVVLDPVKIHSRATLGLRAIVMGGVEIGEGAKVLANSVVMPKTKIPAGEMWGGVPAVKINMSTSTPQE